MERESRTCAVIAMGPSAGAKWPGARLLALGNDLLADDAVGVEIGRRARQRFPGLEVIITSEAGLALLDYVTGVERLVVVDSVQTGTAPPGSVHELGIQDLRGGPAIAPHGVGLNEVLELAGRLGLATPNEVRIFAVEAADCLTIGGAMHPAVEQAIGAVLEKIGRWLGQER